LSTAAIAAQMTERDKFVVLRNGYPIGTSTISVRCSGPDTLVKISTSIAVKLVFLTLYRFDQEERERWVDGRFVSMVSTTDDDGTMHHVYADKSGGELSVTADGETKRMPGNLLPSSLWNPALARQTSALSTVNGKLLRIVVTDRGAEDLLFDGCEIVAQHYSLRGLFPQDVWYDRRGDLLKPDLNS
jgi:uncharacterized protein DUF6134